MKNMNETPPRASGPGLPGNLTVWFTERRLLELVLDAVQDVDLPPTSKSARMEMGLPPKMMLTLLTYCYTAGRVGSDEIVRDLSDNSLVRYICAHHYPKWNEIRLFRRHHREELRQCLAQVYQQAWANQVNDGQASFEGFDWIEGVLRVDIDKIVSRKLEQAILLDWVDLED